jgi:hypothetical protein
MARIRQQYPQNYSTSGNISTEFESLIRYLNSAELGNNTVGELLNVLFDSDGVWQGPIAMRMDSEAGLQYRVGTYTDPELGWLTLAALADIRGAAGTDTGTLGAPIFFGRVDITPTSAQALNGLFDYSFAATDELLIWKNGTLLREDTPTVLHDYSKDSTSGSTSSGEVKLNALPTTSNVITIVKVRTTAITGYVRTNFDVTGSAQSNFPFVFDENTTLHVYKNGIFQREGGTNDYTLVPASNIVQFVTPVPVITPNPNVVTILTVQNTTNQAVTGLMLEEKFVNSATGLINFSTLGIDNGDIAQAKVNGLAAALLAAANIATGASAPLSPALGDLWMDTSGSSLPTLKFYDTSSSQWINTSPESSLPSFVISDANKLLRVNGTGTALQFATQDLSSVIPITAKGTPNGVATLDSLGRMPFAQLPSILATQTLYLKPDLTALNTAVSGSATTYSFVVSRFLLQKATVTSLAARCSGGTATVALAVDGVTTPVGTSFALSTSPAEPSVSYMTGSVSSVQIDASTGDSKSIGVNLTNLSSSAQLVGLELIIAVSIVT